MSLLIAVGCAQAGNAQFWTRHPSDTLYVVDHFHIVTARVYLSTKSNSFTVADGNRGSRLIYRPNNQVNIGFGASYHSLSLNIGFGLNALNKDDHVRGATNYFDAQANIFIGRWAANIILGTYRGYYIADHDKAALGWDVPTALPFRGDVRQTMAGLSATHIFNHTRFSFRAALTQDAWQRRSAGSWLLGGFVHVNAQQADSSLVPTALQDEFSPNLQIREGTFADVGAMGGYAHTFVLHERWFLTLSASAGAGLDLCWWRIEPLRTPPIDATHGGLALLGQGRAAMGYNHGPMYIGVGGNIEGIAHTIGTNERYRWNSGNLRFSIARRLDRRIRSADRMLEKIR